MSLKDIRRHLLPLLATPKGRTKRYRGGIRSTRKGELEEEAGEAIAFEEDIHPQRGSAASEGVNVTGNILCFAAPTEKEKRHCVY